MPDQNISAAVAGRSSIVLLTEDDVLIRAAASEALREAGFIVVEAANADEALSLVSSGLKPDVLFTDVRMPGMHDGLALARRLQMQLPRLLIFIASGHVDPVEAMKQAHQFFRKPYNVSVIISSLHAALDAR